MTIRWDEVDLDPKSGVSATQGDMSRETVQGSGYQPGRRLLNAIRDYHRLQSRRNVIGFIGAKWAVFRHRLWSAISGADIPINCNIGVGLLIPHPNGIVIHANAKIGPNCLIFQQATIGMTSGGVPVLEGHVDVGAGAKILGAVRIGRHAKIGANAVVLCDVPAGATAIGIPARVRCSPGDKEL